MFGVYGIGAAQARDRENELLMLKGLDISNLRYINDEHSPYLSQMIGAITKAKKIYSENECEDARQRQCWQHAQVPFLYIEGQLASGDGDSRDGHPDAESAVSLIKFTHRLKNSPLTIGLSVEGGTVARDSNDDTILTHTVGEGVSLTVKPANPKCLLFPMINLQKSLAPLDPPARYWQALQQPAQKKSFIEVPKHIILQNKLMTLKKSLDDYWAAFTHISCKKCGQPIRFFKSSSDLPNGCPNCGNHFSMAEIWKALNR